MRRAFYRAIANLLDLGKSGILMTALIEKDGCLETYKALLDDGCLTLEDEVWRPFWEQAAAALPQGALPCMADVDGVCVFFEQVSPHQQLVICGGGHIAKPLAEIGALLDFDVTVIDDRPEFANRERFPTAREVVCAPFEQALDAMERSDEMYYVIVTNGHLHDRGCLQRVLDHGRFAYCGMIGSRKKVSVVMEQMERSGYARELLDRVYAPIGLRIGAQTPAEIAVCIAAQLIQVRSGRAGDGFDRAALDALAQGVPMMLATVVSKRGSAPRAVGAKLLTDGERLFGTIGGGAGEAQVMALTREVLDSGAARLVECDLTNQDAGKAGMVCGGVTTVLLEPIQ